MARAITADKGARELGDGTGIVEFFVLGWLFGAAVAALYNIGPSCPRWSEPMMETAGGLLRASRRRRIRRSVPRRR
jgi:hypothetical protein